jgi:hypothetical protein
MDDRFFCEYLDDDVDWRFLNELFFIGGLLVLISDCRTTGSVEDRCDEDGTGG